MKRRNQCLRASQRIHRGIFSHSSADETRARSTRSVRSSYRLLSGRSPVRFRPGAPPKSKSQKEKQADADTRQSAGLWDIRTVVGNPRAPLYIQGAAAAEHHHVKVVRHRAQRVDPVSKPAPIGDIRNAPVRGVSHRFAQRAVLALAGVLLAACASAEPREDPVKYPTIYIGGAQYVQVSRDDIPRYKCRDPSMRLIAERQSITRYILYCR